jgi:hypothetical protein
MPPCTASGANVTPSCSRTVTSELSSPRDAFISAKRSSLSRLGHGTSWYLSLYWPSNQLLREEVIDLRRILFDRWHFRAYAPGA